MKKRTKPKLLEHFIKLENILKSVPVGIEPLTFPPFMPASSKKQDIGAYQKEIIEYNPSDFSITIHGISYPFIFVDAQNKTARAYPARYFKKRLPVSVSEKTEELMGVYQKSLNALRRHGYSITYKEILGP
jgi:hypothetical protein